MKLCTINKHRICEMSRRLKYNSGKKKHSQLKMAPFLKESQGLMIVQTYNQPVL